MSEAKIDIYLEQVLRAAGSRFQYYDPISKDKLRKAMRTVLEDAAKQPAS